MDYGKVKITERGWPGHFICAHSCMFRRNTLLEYGDKKWVVSTIGSFLSAQGEVSQIGWDRWYETMVFEAKMKDGYIDADVLKEIHPDNECGIWGKTWEQVLEEHPYPDNDANEMHKKVVAEMAEKITRK